MFGIRYDQPLSPGWPAWVRENDGARRRFESRELADAEVTRLRAVYEARGKRPPSFEVVTT